MTYHGYCNKACQCCLQDNVGGLIALQHLDLHRCEKLAALPVRAATCVGPSEPNCLTKLNLIHGVMYALVDVRCKMSAAAQLLHLAAAMYD